MKIALFHCIDTHRRCMEDGTNNWILIELREKSTDQQKKMKLKPHYILFTLFVLIVFVMAIAMPMPMHNMYSHKSCLSFCSSVFFSAIHKELFSRNTHTTTTAITIASMLFCILFNWMPLIFFKNDFESALAIDYLCSKNLNLCSAIRLVRCF